MVSLTEEEAEYMEDIDDGRYDRRIYNNLSPTDKKYIEKLIRKKLIKGSKITKTSRYMKFRLTAKGEQYLDR